VTRKLLGGYLFPEIRRVEGVTAHVLAEELLIEENFRLRLLSGNVDLFWGVAHSFALPFIPFWGVTWRWQDRFFADFSVPI